MADVPAAILPLLVAAFVDRPPWPLLKKGSSKFILYQKIFCIIISHMQKFSLVTSGKVVILKRLD